MPDNAGLDDLRRGINDAADGSLGLEAVPLDTAGIDALDHPALELAAMPVKIPVWHAIHGGHHAGVIGQQRLHLADGRAELVRLQPDDDEILRAKLGGIVGAGRTHDDFLVVLQQAKAVAPHRFEMRAARDQADIDPGLSELGTDVSTSRSGAEDAYLHCRPSPL